MIKEAIQLVFINLSDIANEKNKESKNTNKVEEAKQKLKEQREKAQSREHERGRSR